MKTWTKQFDLSDMDTCMPLWRFDLAADAGTIRIVEVDIPRDKKGCVGHPKTIAALLKGSAVDALDLEGLSQTTCSREMSCGMALAHCVSAIKDSVSQEGAA